MYFFFNDTATTEIYTLSLTTLFRSAPTPSRRRTRRGSRSRSSSTHGSSRTSRSCPTSSRPRSEEHTSELQSRQYLVCRLLLEKKKKSHTIRPPHTARTSAVTSTQHS